MIKDPADCVDIEEFVDSITIGDLKRVLRIEDVPVCEFCREPFEEGCTVTVHGLQTAGEIDVQLFRGKLYHTGCILDYISRHGRIRHTMVYKFEVPGKGVQEANVTNTDPDFDLDEVRNTLQADCEQMGWTFISVEDSEELVFPEDSREGGDLPDHADDNSPVPD